MSSTSSVSVVIPAFEKLRVLEIVLKYFEYQDVPTDRFEVIVVDDGSPEHIGDALTKRSFPFQFRVMIR